MPNLQLSKTPVATAGMLIRKPVEVVFEAFVNPEVTTRFWFTKSSGILEAEKSVTWTWEMYGFSVPVTVKELDVDKRILIEWGEGDQFSTVEWLFISFENGTTYVTISNSGFKGDGDKVMEAALDSKGGFTWLLAGAKAFLEHGIQLNLTADSHPPELASHT